MAMVVLQLGRPGRLNLHKVGEQALRAEHEHGDEQCNELRSHLLSRAEHEHLRQAHNRLLQRVLLRQERLLPGIRKVVLGRLHFQVQLLPETVSVQTSYQKCKN